MDDPLRNEIQPPRPVIQPSVADANQASENNTDSLAINPDNQLAASAYLLLDHLNNKINAVGSFLSEMAESPTEVNPLDRINDAALEFANTIRGLWANQETADDPQMTDTQVNPMNDLTKLITKLWSSQSSPTTENVTNAQVMDKLTEITKRLDELEAKSKTPPPRTSEGQATLKDLASVMEGFTKMAQSLELLHRRIVEVKWNSIDGRQVMTEDIYQRLREHQTAMEERLDEDMAAMQEHIDKRNEWVMEKIAQKISEQVARQQAKQSEELQLFKRAVVGAMVQKQEQPEKKAPQPKRTSGYENYYGPMSLRPNDVALMFPTPPLGSGVGSKMNKTTSNTEEKSGFPFKCDYCYGQRFPTKLFFEFINSQHMAHMHAHIPKPSRPVTDPVRESDLFSTTIPSSSPPASPFQGSSLNRSRYPHVSPELAALSKRLQSVLNPSPPVPDYSQYPPHHGFGSGPQIQKAPNTNPSAPLPNHSQHQPNHRFGYGPQLQKPANTNTNTLPPAVNHSQHPQHHNTSSGQPRNQPNIGLSAVTGSEEEEWSYVEEEEDSSDEEW
ncbi:hypothetical protein QBC41DRAFT_375450 [Cercophora samala]|uniref:Uncharacterized protein n=1 Tax=Cercophora samala TaxID=330535 RepID=A0AA39Z8S1_9PEZI|nr:hypothetical protein QBC41DRAFT_375450 [Cercophora samala]